MDFEGRGALITGSTSGIGEAIALRLAKEGANTVVTGRNRARGEAVARQLGGIGPGRSRFIAADLIRAEEPHRLAREAEEWLNGVDILVNNAATGGAGPSTEITISDWDAVFGLNVRAAYLLATFLMERMSKRGGGAVINVTSSVAYRGWPGYSAYASSKAALDAMTRCWAATYGWWGVRVAAIAPGPAVTAGALSESSPEDIAAFCSGFGVGRCAQPHEIAAAVAFVAGDRADYVHGSTLHVDGGMVETFGYQPISVRAVAREPADRRPSVTRKRLLDRFR